MISGWSRSLAPVFGFIAAYAAGALLITNSYYQLILTMVVIWACLGSSWNLLSGYTGLVSFGHAAFFGIGAYTTALAQIELGISPWVSIPCATLLGALAGLLVGLPTFRLRGHYFALAMLAYPLALLYVFEWLGYQELAIPLERSRPVAYMQFADARVYTIIALVLLLAIMLVTIGVERSRFGLALMAIRQDEPAAQAAGINTRKWKLLALTLSAAAASTVGAFYAVVQLVVTPGSVFGLLVSAQALTVAMFGGVGTVWGPVIGAMLLIPAGELLHAALADKLPGIQGVLYGIAIICVVLAAPEGIFWKVRDLFAANQVRRPDLPEAASAKSSACSSTADTKPIQSCTGRAILEVRGLSKAFGGLQAVQDVGFTVREGSILGLIGPNGAGKTTVLNLLNGFVKPDAGQILFRGRDLAGLQPHVICSAGIGRTFQVMRPFMRMTAADNVLVGSYVRAGSDTIAREYAATALERVGLAARAHVAAGTLTTKELRLMELARALAGQPQMLLLDETFAGLGAAEIREVSAVVRKLAADGLTILIVEHSMQEMVRLVDSFVVLDHGRLLTEGSPDEVTRDTRVIEAYLGKKWIPVHASS